ncbi:PLP-dependent aminotransferase family protein [Ramlibacter sp.]|uniref:aminotransferase-like domain-containing protein n=1 Tax=Ramlibacter sp. TaxID=1917967 RepID=UPI001830AE4E|nr:PLP-dependent aminotransferase family protein [Ramlibacter sp.]MBA2674980.1 PLP-dependent aminotransferase family protein [Ramlibacter sp.]
MKLNDSQLATPWTLARRMDRMNFSAIRELLKLSDRPGIISFAGGLPSPKAFPVEEIAAACAKVLRDDASSALQYASTEGFLPLREAVTRMLPWPVDPAQVLITNGSQQALDLVAKMLIDPGSKLLVEMPTYLGALQSFAPLEPEVVAVGNDADGVDLDDLSRKAPGARFFYVLPNFQNPTGKTMGEAKRTELIARTAEAGLPLLEDNPYGDVWFDTPPPPPLAARNPDNVLYMGSFSKVLSPGIRMGFLVSPPAVSAKLVQLKQASDVHSPIFNQRMVAEVIKDGFLDRHVPKIRALYKAQRDAMLAALERELGGLGASWNKPDGGMFLWVRLPEGVDASALLPKAVDNGVAFVPGAPFYASDPDPRAMRLSFVTASVAQIDTGIAALGATLRQVLAR